MVAGTAGVVLDIRNWHPQDAETIVFGYEASTGWLSLPAVHGIIRIQYGRKFDLLLSFNVQLSGGLSLDSRITRVGGLARIVDSIRSLTDC